MSIQEKERFIKNIFNVVDDFPPEVQLIMQAKIEGLQEGLRIGLTVASTQKQPLEQNKVS